MIPLFKVFLPPNLGAKLQDVFDLGAITEGVYADEFEKQFGEYIQAPNVSLVNSCTSALTLAYRMSGVRAGTEVISTPMTCMATNEPIVTMGAKIVWADINPRTGNIDPSSVGKLVTSRTKAVVGVHWAGFPFDVKGVYDELRRLGREDIKVISDAAHALGSWYDGKPVGNEADFVCFSFQAIKHLTTGDGGAIASKFASDDVQIKKLRWFGLDRKFKGDKWAQDITDAGYKFHMNNVNAAIGIEQMKYVRNVISAHEENNIAYNKLIQNPKVRPIAQDPSSRSACWIYTVLVDDRERFKQYMNDNDIACDVVHFRNDKYSVFNEFASDNLPGTDEFCSKMINIPVGWWLSDEAKSHIVYTVNKYV